MGNYIICLMKNLLELLSVRSCHLLLLLLGLTARSLWAMDLFQPRAAAPYGMASGWMGFGSALNGDCFAMVPDGQGGILAGGDFTTAGGTLVNHIARWDGSSWQALGSGLNGACRAIAVDGSGQIYVGGEFTAAGGATATFVARWDGSSWHPLGTGLNNDCNALAIGANGDLYVGGEFNLAGGTAAEAVARWDGSGWQALGGGLTIFGGMGLSITGPCFALLATGSGDLYVGGAFNRAGGIAANGVARWDGGSWSALGMGFNDLCLALAMDSSGNLIAGGQFSVAGGAVADHVARWTGSVWVPIGTGLDNHCYALAVDEQGALLAGGEFVNAGGIAATHVARWDGSTWAGVGDGLNNRCYTLAIGPANQWFAGGRFTQSGSTSLSYAAVWLGSVLSHSEMHLAGQQVGAEIHLKWQADGLGKAVWIEHATDQRSWRQLGVVGLSSEFHHREPADGHNYYRLAYRDAADWLRYSASISVSFTKSATYALFPSATPGPLRARGFDIAAVHIICLDQQGRQVWSKTPGASSVDLSALPSGYYHLLVWQKGQLLFRQGVRRE